ncbi:DeoR/GlpR transcriptional regulator [Sporosarcina sp. Sa2YVA2]|uniref:DeoR/GlpR transcriptional regulator n=1 Tax=Sporosarcina quadrami TaxID=2762234 RepID=A0ABR8UAK3_9BACL|nr:DeoR/GlpR family DNA-binding transcription regulator [Sporosarcina quadrami]MBD7985053.1 DeoR/GlpR transcriptional regulator [Sporosarcina quadrami]
MFTEERRDKILDMLEINGRILAKDVAEEFGLSIDSIRRDLSIMEDQGLLKRTHGGAIPIGNSRTMPQPPSLRYGNGNTYQNAIAKTACTYIQKEQTVFIGGAAIHYVMLKYLPNDFDFTVVTNSVEVAYHLREMKNIQTYLIGGHVKSSGNMTDAIATELARQFTTDLCFAAAGGLSEKGLSTATPEVAVFHKTIFDNSRKIVSLIEHTKFGIDMFSRMYPLEKLDVVITDEETPQDEIDLIMARGMEVLIAK